MIRRPFVPSNLNCDVLGYLYTSGDVDDLGQTMIEVSTPNGILINCGWTPEGDPRGNYQITVTQGFRTLMSPISTRDIDQASIEIERLVRLFCSGETMIRSTSQTFEVNAYNPFEETEFEESALVSTPGEVVYA